jgi:hypothetical protein
VTIASSVVKILDAFEEEGWPDHILDPLSPPQSQRTAQRADSLQLRDTVQSLNRGLTAIRFFADGTGTGVRWERLNSRAAAAHRP